MGTPTNAIAGTTSVIYTVTITDNDTAPSGGGGGGGGGGSSSADYSALTYVGNKVTITYPWTLKTTSIPATSTMTLKQGLTVVPVTAIAISGKVVTLTRALTLSSTSTIKLSYNDGINEILSSDGANEAKSFFNKIVTYGRGRH